MHRYQPSPFRERMRSSRSGGTSNTLVFFPAWRRSRESQLRHPEQVRARGGIGDAVARPVLPDGVAGVRMPDRMGEKGELAMVQSGRMPQLPLDLPGLRGLPLDPGFQVVERPEDHFDLVNDEVGEVVPSVSV